MGGTQISDLRPLLEEAKKQQKAVIALGVYDGNSARLLNNTFSALREEGSLDKRIYDLATFVSGYLVSASRGYPDMAILDESMVEDAFRVIRLHTGGIPAIVDVDTGFGSEAYTVKEAGRRLHYAGVNCVQIEDQHGDKTCGHMDGSLGSGKQVMDPNEFGAIKIKPLIDYAASDEAHKLGHDFLVMARTDSRAEHDLEDALERVKLYNKFGAEILFVEAPQSDAELQAVGQAFHSDPSTHMLANMIEGSPKTPYHPVGELAEMGFSIVYFCIGSIFAANFGSGGMEAYFRSVLSGKDPVKEGVLPADAFERFNKFIGRELAERTNVNYRELIKPK